MKFNLNEKINCRLPSDIIWSDEQLEAIERLKQFLSSQEQVIVLTGFAGTGKTSVMKEFVKYIESMNIQYRLCAPTHKAKLVLQKATEKEAITIHSLLKLAPKLDILRLDFADLQFHSSGTEEIPYKGIIIIDEGSMLSDDLYDLLIDYCSQMDTKIVILGDIAQLQPVNNGGISKVFKNKNIIKLTKIFRQNQVNKLTYLLNDLRNKVVFEFENSEDESIKIYHNPNQFISNILKDIKITIDTRNLNHSKLICYTNKRIDAYNKCIRKFLFNDNKPYHIGELLIGCENYSNKGSEFYNSSDYIISDIKEHESYIPEIGNVPGFTLTLYDGEKEQTLFMLDINNYKNLEYLAMTIENIRMKAVQSKGKARYLKWKKYYDLINSFATPVNLTFDNRIVKSKTLDYGYALSAHRSQGSSYDTVYVDMKNLLLNQDKLELRQLQYVALSRTRNNVNIYI